MPELDDHGVRPMIAAGGQEPGRVQTLAPSRRSVLRGAAAAGTAGIAMTTLSTAVGDAVAKASTTREAGAPDGERDAAGSEPVVLHVRDGATGEIEIFRGTTQTRLYDRDLAAQILRASR